MKIYFLFCQLRRKLWQQGCHIPDGNVCVSNSESLKMNNPNVYIILHFIIIIVIYTNLFICILSRQVFLFITWPWFVRDLFLAPPFLIFTSPCICRPRCCSGGRSASLSAGCPQRRADRSRARAPWCRGPPRGTPLAGRAWRRSSWWWRPGSPGTGCWLALARAQGPWPWPPWPRCACQGTGGRPCWPRCPRRRGAGPGPQAQCVF